MGKTITTYLIDGDPSGAQELTISNKICKMVIIPRADLSIINKREGLEYPAFYILLGESDELTPEAYVGETENFRERVRNHDYNKKFWQKALVFVSKDGAMTKADVQYLEHLAYAEAKKANRHSLSNNKQVPNAPNLPEHQKDSIEEFFMDIKFLTTFIGCNIFDVVEPNAKHLFYMQERGCSASGFFDSTGFTILSGSVVSKDHRPSYAGKEKRDRLLKEYTTEKEGQVTLATDKTFSSPSAAATFCIGGERNGWASWKDREGQTLDEAYRKQLEG